VTDGTGVITVTGLTKRFGPVAAVDAVSFTAGPGMVTGFLGPNGAGKSTTLRMLLGLVSPDAGSATIGGHRYQDLAEPGRQVGAVLEAAGFHPARSGRDHLLVYCTACGYPAARAGEVLELTGLTGAARRQAGRYSLGMRQRLALATALLGDPPVLVLDEPGNGLDPEGIAWLRGLLRGYADAGRTVLFSSHTLAEVEQIADRAVIIAGPARRPGHARGAERPRRCDHRPYPAGRAARRRAHCGRRHHAGSRARQPAHNRADPGPDQPDRPPREHRPE
jgi:ABC-2 type transport system ATP-binding protein